MSDKKTYKNSSQRARSLVLISLFSAIIAVSSFITVPFAVPFTMQLFAVFCSLYLLGGKRGTLSILLYVLLGAAGLPVFSGFTGGIGRLLDLTGGFITGFILSGLTYWLFLSLYKGKHSRLLGLFASLSVCYLSGALWYAFSLGEAFLPALKTAFLTSIVPFIIPDLLKILLSALVCRKIEQYKIL